MEEHLDRYGVSLRDLVWQTDNGAEFKGGFPAALATANMCASRPPTPTRAVLKPSIASKKTSSSIWKIFSPRGESLAKIHTYQVNFNLARPNSHKRTHSPWQIIERIAPRSPLELCLLPPVFLKYYLNDSGRYDVSRLFQSAACVGKPFLLC